MDNPPNFIPKEVLFGKDGLQHYEPIIKANEPLLTITPQHLIKSQVDWDFFTLAPVIGLITYRDIKLIDFDLVEQFQVDMRKTNSNYNVDCLRYAYDQPVFTTYKVDCSNNDILWCMPKEQFKVFKEWLCAQAFTYTSEFNVKAWRIQSGSYKITDPLNNTELANITMFFPETEFHYVAVWMRQGKPDLSIMRKRIQ